MEHAMPQHIEPLRNLDRLGEASYSGIQKNWPLPSPELRSLRWDYLQKVNYSIQDFNATLNQSNALTEKDVVFMIALDDWIATSVVELLKCFKSKIIEGFSFSKESELAKSRKYMRAMRSFITAHPLQTNRHSAFGLDGNLVCIDIRQQNAILKLGSSSLKRLSRDGMFDVDELDEEDIVLYTYTKDDGGEFYVHIGFNPRDIRDDCALCIDKLYELDRYLGRLKKRDFA